MEIREDVIFVVMKLHRDDLPVKPFGASYYAAISRFGSFKRQGLPLLFGQPLDEVDFLSWTPVGYDMYDKIGVGRIIGLQVDGIIMRAIHPFVHHKDTGLNCGALTGLEYHRTDGKFGRSASLQYFDVRVFFETQCPITGVGDLQGELAVLAKLDITVIDLVLIHGKLWSSADVSSTSIGKQYCSENEQPASQDNEQPGEFLRLFLFSISFVVLGHPASLLSIQTGTSRYTRPGPRFVAQ